MTRTEAIELSLQMAGEALTDGLNAKIYVIGPNFWLEGIILLVENPWGEFDHVLINYLERHPQKKGIMELLECEFGKGDIKVDDALRPLSNSHITYSISWEEKL